MFFDNNCLTENKSDITLPNLFEKLPELNLHISCCNSLFITTKTTSKFHFDLPQTLPPAVINLKWKNKASPK